MKAPRGLLVLGIICLLLQGGLAVWVQADAGDPATDADLEETYPLGDMEIEATGGELTVAPVSVGEEVFLGEDRGKLLVLYFTLKNTSAQPINPAEALTVTVLDETDEDDPVEFPAVSPLGAVGADGKNNPPLTKLGRGKRREAFVIVGMTGDAIPSAAVVTDEGSGDALRFDLEDGVEPLLEPYGEPDDPMIVERKIDAALGRNYFTDEFATFVDSVEAQTAFGDERPGAGRQLWVLSFATRNLAPVAAEFGGPETLTMVMDTREKVEAVPTLYTSAGEPCSDAPIGAGGDLDACYCFEAPAGCVPVSVTWQCEQTGLRFVFGGLQEIRSTEELLRAQTPEGETPEPPAAQPTSRRQGRSALTYTDRMVNRANYRFTSSIYNRVGWKLDRAVDRIIDKVLPF